MPVNPYTSQAISGYNANPPPDDGSQTSANKVEWQKHLDKIGGPLKTLVEGVNSAANTAINVLALTDSSRITADHTIVEADWHNALLAGATIDIFYPAPADYENGWHNWVFNGSTGSITLSASGAFFDQGGTLATSMSLNSGNGAHIINTATEYLVFTSVTTPATLATDIAPSLGAQQADMEAGTATELFVSPSVAQYHQSAAKAWVRFNGIGTVAIDSSYGVSSITDLNPGDYQVNFSSDFSAATDYCAVALVGTGVDSAITAETAATGNLRVRTTKGTTATEEDTGRIYVAFFGDQ